MYIHDYIDEQIRAHPDHIALVCGKQRLSYQKLGVQSSQLAHYLQKQGVGPEIRVGIAFERSIELIIAILAVIKSGGVYVPLDPSYPSDRISFMLSDSDVPILLTTTLLAKQLPGSAEKVICLEDIQQEVSAEPGDGPEISIKPENLLYVIYTSGSSGTPKGVMVPHLSVARLFHDFRPFLQLKHLDVWTLFHSCSFGYSVWEMFGCLSSGGTLVVVPQKEATDPASFYQLLQREGVTILSQTPSAFRQFLLSEAFSTTAGSLCLRYIIFSGEPIVANDISAWFKQYGEETPRLIDTYAITEAGGQIAYQVLTRSTLTKSGIQSIGKLLSDTKVYILDSELNPVAEGIRGELCVAGDGLARGYLNLPDLTQKKFVVNPVVDSPQTYMYKTGDCAYFDDLGNIVLCGRLDNQVKLRGYRIELGEIEHVLRDHAAVSEAAVLLRERSDGEKSLVAYIASKQSPQDKQQPDRQLLALNDEAELWPSLGEFQCYDELLYQVMKSDPDRIRKIRQALAMYVKGKVVLDIGTGSEVLLAQLCINAGATRVYAIELLEDAYLLAKKRISTLGLSSQIFLLHGDSRDLELPEKVDVCLQGICGNIGSADGVVSIMNDARRFFKKNTRAVPSRCTTKISAVYLPDMLAENPEFKTAAAYYTARLLQQAGVDFEPRICIKNFPVSHLISNVEDFELLDFSAEIELEYSKKTRFTINRDGRFDGLLLWTEVEMSPGVVIDYLQNQMGWLPVYFPLFHPAITVRKGDIIDAEWICHSREEHLTPDYRISGKVIRNGRILDTFNYQTSPHENMPGNNEFLKKLMLSYHASTAVLSDSGLRTYLTHCLPEYMVPTSYVYLDTLPVSANGKLDRNALLETEQNHPCSGHASNPPTSASEIAIEKIWNEVLGGGDFGIEDNFFEMGGNSLLATQVTLRLNKLYKVELTLTTLFYTPTIRGLAEKVNQEAAGGVSRSNEAIKAQIRKPV